MFYGFGNDKDYGRVLAPPPAGAGLCRMSAARCRMAGAANFEKEYVHCMLRAFNVPHFYTQMRATCVPGIRIL